MLTYRDLVAAFHNLGIEHGRPVIAHASLAAFEDIRGGSEAVVGALISSFAGVMMPTFTYTTMITPLTGPPDNAIGYGSDQDANRMAEFYRPDLPADRLMGRIAETLRQHPKARRSSHPILSFAGENVEQALSSQTLEEPLAPIRVLTEAEGWALLLGVDHTVNTSIHYAERLAGRRQFVRWALTPHGVQECPGFPACSDGFQELAPRLEGIARQGQVGPANVIAIPLPELVEIARAWIAAEPDALLCSRPDCPRCQVIRSSPPP